MECCLYVCLVVDFVVMIEPIERIFSQRMSIYRNQTKAVPRFDIELHFKVASLVLTKANQSIYYVLQTF